jgi:hypothetical protein
MTARTGLGQDNRDRIIVARQPSQDSWGRIVKKGTAGTCQPGQARLKNQPGEVSGQTKRAGCPEHDSKDMKFRHPG